MLKVVQSHLQKQQSILVLCENWTGFQSAATLISWGFSCTECWGMNKCTPRATFRRKKPYRASRDGLKLVLHSTTRNHATGVKYHMTNVLL